ncbi:MAG: ATP-binding protein [Bacteroidota bacterium]
MSVTEAQARQNTGKLDSLKKALSIHLSNDSIRIVVLKNLAFYSNDPKQGIKYADQLIKLARKNKNIEYIARGYLQKGYKLLHLGDNVKASKCLLESISYSKSIEHVELLATGLSAIADIYSSLGDHSNAISYYRQSIDALENSKDDGTRAGISLNLGDEYFKINQPDSAMFYFEIAGEVYKRYHYDRGIAYYIGNTGKVYASLGQNELAKERLDQAVSILLDLGDLQPICNYLLETAVIYQKNNQYAFATDYAQQSLDYAKEYNLKQEISDANQKLSEIYELMGQHDQSLLHYKDFIAYRDSIINLETVRDMASQQTEFEVNLRESEISNLEKDKQLQQTYIIIVVILLLLSLVAILYFRQRFRTSRLLAVAQQKEHSNRVSSLLQTQETRALQAMVRGKEDERKHLAKDLHNHLGSLLATVKMNLNGLESPDKAKYNTIIHLVDQATQDVRNISHELNMGVSDDFGLLPALKELVNHLRKAKQLEISLSAGIDGVQMDSQSEILIYRIVQELISNALKHAEASTLSISLTGIEEGNIISILVEDDGKGFSPNASAKGSNGIGLNSLKEMIQKLDGEINIDSQPERGTVISIDIPIEIPMNIIES